MDPATPPSPPVDNLEAQVMLWHLSELNFRFELLALHKCAGTARHDAVNYNRDVRNALQLTSLQAVDMITAVEGPVIGGLISPPSFDLHLSWGSGLVISHCLFFMTSLLPNIQYWMRYWCSWGCSGLVLHWHLLHFPWSCSCYSYLPFMSLPFLLPVILDACPLSSFLWYGLPYTHSQKGIKVRLIIILYCNLLIVPQGSGLCFLVDICIAVPTSFESNFSFLAFLPLDWSISEIFLAPHSDA